MKAKLFLVIGILLMLLNCKDRNEENYEPEVASVISNTFSLSIVDEKGQDLLADKNFVGAISATGNWSKKTQTFSSVNWEKEGGLNFITIHADLPDVKTMQPAITETNRVSYGSTELVLNIANASTKLKCDFRLTASSDPKLIGGSGLYLIKIKLSNGEEVTSDVVLKNLTLVYSNGTLSIKK